MAENRRSFLEELQEAKGHSYAVGAFNIFNHLSARAVISAAEELGLPVILQTSVVTVREFGTSSLGAMLRQLADEASVNVLIHLDHCQDVELAKACVDAGWDAVMYDGSRLSIEENIAGCREVVEYAHRKGVQVEGELGRIVGVEDAVKVSAEDASLAGLEESIRFVRESGIDAFAPAIGTAHGVYKGTPRINFDLVAQLKDAVSTPVVIHGGTGLSEEAFRRLIRSGGAKVNVSTAIKHAYLDTCRDYFKDAPEKPDPIGFDRVLSHAIKTTARNHMVIFSKDRT
ncbi:MAG: class II fructose-bisphosphate aldolase [Blautia sp.]|nr:class II fructose-bisphosphate aldolase [Blautia sp.]